MRSAEPPGLGEAIALGLLQGPTELLPVSSSAHTTLIPWLAGRPYARLDGELRKSFELALHAGAALALALSMGRELLRDGGRLDAQRAGAVALALAIPAGAGLALEDHVERRLGGVRSIAAGLALGGLALALADARARRRRGGARTIRQAGPRDGVALGLAQAVALVPGVSRNGATLTAALALGFDRRAADALSWHAGLPVMLGAGALRAARLARRGVSPRERAALAAGAGAAFVSTLLSARVLGRRVRVERSLLPIASYRVLLAALAASRLRRHAARTPN
ncbi:MAG TPA: undecaprenyl-diphosphate phosphatase [Solirubrobacteraceae bacterium]|nr:undecaprenyl-diphosphate phosphatase [Solirubrobacteraceae bacterium]